MSSRHRDKVTTNERMETAKLTTPDRHAESTQNVSPGSDMSAPRTDSTGSGVMVCQREKRRREHNDTEKKRKEQIKACICRMGELLPSSYVSGERQSTLETVEKSLNYMRELKEARTKFSVKENTLQQEINSLKTERDKLLDIIKSAGLSSDTIPTNGVSSTTDVKDDNPRPKSKSKRKPTLSSSIQYLHEREKEKQSQQEIISSSVSVNDESGNNMAGQMMNLPGGPFSQNMMFNPTMMMQNGNQMMMPGLMGPMGMMTPGQNAGTSQGIQQQNGGTMMMNGLGNLSDGNKQSGDDSDAGLLQLAMQDAGITPNSSASQPGSSAVTPSIAEANQESESPNGPNNPLQTLASVATSQDMSGAENGGSTENQTGSTSSAGTLSVTSAGATVPVMSNGGQNFTNNLQNNMLNMPVVGNQSVMAGQQQQQQTQQIMFVNEQGIPMIANVPMGLDPNSQQNSFNNLQKQGMLAGVNQQGLLKDQSGGLEQNQMNNALALAQQQANMAALLGQSANLQNMAFQQQNLLGGNIIQTPNGQFIQQITPQAQMQQLQGQGQLVGVQGQGQGIVVGGPQGNQNNNFMTQFAVPNQSSQLPSALILPNGQIIPVVTNPNSVNQNGTQNFGQGQMNQTRMAGPQIQGQMQQQQQQQGDGQVMSGPGSQGLLMTAASGPQVVSTSAGASLNTSVVPTSAIQSVMTTQIQGSSHVQSHKTTLTTGTGATTDVSQSNIQSKMVGLTTNILNPNQQLGGSAIMPGGKTGTTPILISLPINGQPTTVLLDPVTMQVLGTVQSQQQGSTASGPAGAQTSTPAVANHSPVASQAPTATTSNSSKSKSGKNNANQRAICPKPSLGGDGVRTQTGSKKKKSKASSKNKDTVQPDSLSDSLQIQIPESTTDPETTSVISSESTDILAKAAESIFSSPLGEMSTVGGFYNPANEDNPLHIDTSAAEPDDDKKSPDKNDPKSKKPMDKTSVSSIQNSVIGLDSVTDGKTVPVSVSVTKVSTTGSVTSVFSSNDTSSNSDNVTSLSATLEELAGIKFSDTGDIQMDLQTDKHTDLMDICLDTPVKQPKKGKTNAGNKANDKKDATAKVNKNVNKVTNANTVNKVGSPQKKAAEKPSEVEKNDTESQMDIESTLIHIPEAITFSENDISDVLDQVEKLGDSPLDSPKPNTTNKKSKMKRTKTVDSDGEPSSKKRKSAKEVKEVKQADLLKDIPLSMPSALSSVYDFDDSDDIVPIILPLNAKDYTSLSSKPGPPEVTNKPPQTNAQTKNKSQPASKSNKPTTKQPKEVESAPKPPLIDNPMTPLFTFPEPVEKMKEKPKEPETTKSVQPSGLPSAQPEPATSLPDIDTTTSLFGYVVPKKLQRPEQARQMSQASPKLPPTVQPSQATNTQNMPPPPAKVNTVSPKQPMVSPKSSIVSPQDTSMSPEQSMVSPKLTIVSPSQTLLSDNDTISPKGYSDLNTMNKPSSVEKRASLSPKEYAEMTPMKKRTYIEKNDDLKVSSFSALNSDNVSLPFSSKDNTSISTSSSQSMGVITSVKSGVGNSSEKISEPSKNNVLENQNMAMKPTNTDNTQVNLQNKMSSNVTSQKLPNNTSRNYASNPVGDKNFSTNMSPPSSSYKSLNTSQRAPVSNVSPQNNQFSGSGQFMHDPVFSSQNSNTNKPMGKDSGMKSGPMSSVNNDSSLYRAGKSVNDFPTPYTVESLFTNTQDKVIKSPPNVNISTNPSILNQQKADHANMSKNRNNAYSVDSFVQSSRENNMQMRNDPIGSQSNIGLPPNNDMNNPSTDFTRLQNENSPDGFSMATIGLNLTPITSTTPSSSFMDLNLPNSSSVISSNVSSSSFSFSLSSTSTTLTTTSSGGLGHHQFPFYPPLSTSTPGSNDNVMPSMPNMGMFPPPPHGNANNNNVIQRNNTVMHPSGTNSNLQRGDNSHMSRVEQPNIPRVESHPMPPRNDNNQPLMSEDIRDQGNNNTNKPSCSKQTNKMSKPPGPPNMQEPFNFPNASPNEPNFFHDSHMKSNVGKSPTEQMRKPPEPMNPPRSANQGSHADKRGGTVDRSPQMMNSGQSYYSPSFPPAKPLNAPSLHHPSLMPPDERGRNMSNRSPYDAHYPPSSSQPYSSMPHNYPNRFDSGNVSYSRDNTGTQPLSHSAISSGGRKSANPQQNQQTSVVKPPPKQSAPPLVPMAQQQPTPQGPRPTPPNSHRPTTPITNQSAPTPQVNQTRQSKGPSRNTKPQKKSTGTKPIPFVEVDSNLSNSIFETNRSITPFFPMQNLSPQSRAMQHESSPFLHGNFFGPGPRFPNSNTPMPKNSDIGPHFNPLFPPRGAQNGLGLNFQPGFGMNPLHGNHGNGPQITPHSAPHMANFSLNNIFPESGSQNESSLNISPIKFPHTNFQHQGMDPNAMQQHHPYNRGHPSVMSLNSILGPNHHGFDGRMNTSMAGPFHSHGHPSFIPPLNFSMHDP